MRESVRAVACGRRHRAPSGFATSPVQPLILRHSTKARNRMTTVDLPRIAPTHTRVTGGGGIQLHVVDAGNRHARPILLIHGFSQSWLSWQRQIESDLASDYRLVALDLRGHGQSDKPRDSYADGTLWADDVDAVIRELNLEQPVLCGWSYGSIVALDYIRKYGEHAVGGIAFVDGITRLGSEEALAVLTPELLSLVPGFFSTEVEESARSLESLLRMCFVQEPSSEDLYRMLGYNLTVPPHVRQALFSRCFDNEDLMPKIRKPVLVLHGAEDAVVKASVVEQHKRAIPHAQVEVMAHAGHAPFWDDAANFNQHLRAFCQTLLPAA
jgi:non-heme chloroperoxidase